MGELYAYQNKFMMQYNSCAMTHDKLVESIKLIQEKQDKK